MMEKETRVLELDAYEYSVVLNALANYRNDALAKGRTTDLIDEVLLKAIASPSKGKACYKSRKGRPRLWGSSSAAFTGTTRKEKRCSRRFGSATRGWRDLEVRRNDAPTGGQAG